MSFFSSLMRQIRDLWARLFARAPAPAVTALPASAPEIVVAPPAAAAPKVVAAPEIVAAPPAVVSTEDSRVAAAAAAFASGQAVAVSSQAAGEVSASSLTGVLLRAAVEVTPEPAARSEGAGAFTANAQPVLSVRQFFARVAAAAPGGIVVDFAAWQNASVERYFTAMAAPERTERRGPALAEEVSLGGAFDGFQWD